MIKKKITIEVSLLAYNIKLLRKRKNISQETFAEEIKCTRSAVGSYEEGRAEPPLCVLKRMSEFFAVSMDEIYSCDIENKYKPKK